MCGRYTLTTPGGRALAERFDVGDAGHLVMDWEYLLVTCRRA